jgi:hypothetical protein
MDEIERLGAARNAAELEVETLRAANKRLQADYRKLWEMTVGPHTEPEPGTPDTPMGLARILARAILADDLAHRDRLLAAFQRVEAWRDELATEGPSDDHYPGQYVAQKLTELLTGSV